MHTYQERAQVERHKETLKAIAFILLILGTLAFVEGVIAKDDKSIKLPGQRGELLME